MSSLLPVMGSLLFPAALVVLFFVASAGRQAVLRTPRLRWLASRLRLSHESGERGTGATTTEELHALLYPSKRIQLEQRRIELVLRDDENDGAPRKTGIDLTAGTATIRRSTSTGSRSPRNQALIEPQPGELRHRGPGE
ncbi:DUF6191 domain-containing protein [Kitasatospora sp. NPDC097643]|uniref:DUF6191 domain-containing protein n=1 Tax=Kitasatospora sp. NPDC097643 TaxID=3157230 RepID=UPI003324A547